MEENCAARVVTNSSHGAPADDLIKSGNCTNELSNLLKINNVNLAFLTNGQCKITEKWPKTLIKS